MDTGTIPVTLASQKELGEDQTRDVLRFVHGLLMAPNEAPEALSGLLAGLARAFGAVGAGLAVGTGPGAAMTHVDVDGRPVSGCRLPWENRPELLEQASRAATALREQGADRTTWLWTVLETSGDFLCPLWVTGAKEQSWSDSEAAALPLAGQAIVRIAETTPGPTPLGSLLERARLQGNLEKTALLTGRLAHDFGNVLTGILGFSELSLSQLPADSLPRLYVDEIWQSAHQGARWVQKLQWFSRRRPQHFVPAVLPAVVAQEEARVRPAWHGMVVLNVALPAELPTLGLDAESLREILGELLDNAREAIAGQGVVTLSARAIDLTDQDCQELLGNTAPGPHVEITVTDSGCGISADARRRLFAEPFFSNKPRHRGLGLAVVYGILQTYRGGLRFGPDPEQGTAVRVLFPALASAAAPTPVSAPERAAGARVLAVDDDTLTVRFISSVLETAGYQVQTARSAAEALDLVATSKPFDLVLTDIVMPEGDGFDLVRQLQGHGAGINVLFMSCRLDGQEWPKDEILRDYDLLRKPFRPEGLLRAVRAAIGRRQIEPTAKPRACVGAAPAPGV